MAFFISDFGFFTGILRERSLCHPPDPYLRPEACWLERKSKALIDILSAIRVVLATR